jgi:hypothetical protein
VDVEAVSARAPDDGAVVPRRLAVRAAAVEGNPADAAGVVIRDPFPGRSETKLVRHIELRFDAFVPICP